MPVLRPHCVRATQLPRAAILRQSRQQCLRRQIRRDHHEAKPSAQQRAYEADVPLRRPPNPYQQRDQRSTVRFAKTRVAIGIPFIGLLIYSMFFSDEGKALRNDAPSIASRDTLAKRESGVSESSPMRLRMEALVKEHQQNIVRELEKLDGTRFKVDKWDRPEGGGGITCVMQDGSVFEKAGVNTSVVYGTLPRPAIQRMRANHKALDMDVESLEFFAAGLSLVLHPKNPMAPTVHLNYRYFETTDPKSGQPNAWWFGGGCDLTPCYLFDEDAIHFHKTIKEACDKHDKTYYPRFKEWCDKYFSNKHRNETRGVGGIFFDDLDDSEKDREQLFAFIEDGLEAFLPSYMPIIRRRKDMPFSDKEKEWQQLRRGRYVEFNLIHDRGTSFGLNAPNPRVESILMSLPLTARWEYMHEPAKGSKEERLLSVLKAPREWV